MAKVPVIKIEAIPPALWPSGWLSSWPKVRLSRSGHEDWEVALLAWRPVGILLFSVAEPESSKFGTGTAINSCGFFCDVMADHAHNNWYILLQVLGHTHSHRPLCCLRLAACTWVPAACPAPSPRRNFGQSKNFILSYVYQWSKLLTNSQGL
jgi:hypothetical protein